MKNVKKNALNMGKGLAVLAPAFNSGKTPSVEGGLEYMALMMNSAMGWLVAFGLLIASIMIIVSGIKFMIAGGDEEKRKNAVRSLVFSLVGVAVVLLAQNFIEVIKSFLGVV